MIKFMPIELAKIYLATFAKMRKTRPDLFVNFDMVGEEDTLNQISQYLDSILSFRTELEKEQGVDIPFKFHAGETLDPNNTNLYDAILLNTRRIGHGFQIIHHPSLLKHVIDNQVCLEVSLISNQLLGYVRDLRNHPVRTFISLGVPVVICSDDPALFRYSSLSYDYIMLMLAFELKIGDLKKLILNSIEYAV